MQHFRLTKPRGLSAGPASHYPQQPSRSEQADARWQGLDNVGFDEVPLGSPPLRVPQADSNGGPPQLEKVAHSLRAFSKGNGGAAKDAAAKEASQLRAENAILKQRLAAVESVSRSQAELAFPTGCCGPVIDRGANTCCHRLALCYAIQELQHKSLRLLALCCNQRYQSARHAEQNVIRGTYSQEAVEAFGELEDLKDKLQAAEKARAAVEAQLHSMPPHRNDSGDLAATVQDLCMDLKVTLLL